MLPNLGISIRSTNFLFIYFKAANVIVSIFQSSRVADSTIKRIFFVLNYYVFQTSDRSTRLLVEKDKDEFVKHVLAISVYAVYSSYNIYIKKF